MAQIVLELEPELKSELDFWSRRENKSPEIFVVNIIKDIINDKRRTGVKAIYKAQEAFKGAADELDLKDDEDVQDLVNEVRYKIK
ncbi:MAG: hypothetical protein IJG62_04340 [Synergistaceae bacterium]|nr:hypothetical protein [Synergistaceae bacterium]MBQ3627097.1 hypothetical protein [Synergistaceae bacterium]MBQ4419186.1 hypothetical protein [Synergistaceae bacterium]MBQ6909988.1 hypothetical protein [Synergistaceae bacterium]MBQ7569858.1 hypothetical protein [Synergistaceae bacterium]